jgi:acyl-CoA thioesterase I
MEKDIRICFIGDSFVNGTGDETALGWAGRLCADAAKKNYPITYYNLGIGRDTSSDILVRFESEIASRLPKNCDSRLVFSFGVNDTVIENGVTRVTEQQSIDNIIKIINQTKSIYKIIIVGPPAVDDTKQNQRIKLLAAQFKMQTDLLGIPYIDIFSSLVNDKHYINEISNNDGAHPKSKGYIKIADIVSQSKNWWF